MFKSIILVAGAGALGAIARYAIVTLASWQGWSPWGTFAVNVLGCFAIGVLFAVANEAEWFETYGRNLLVFGFLGAFTTFSAFSMDTLQLAQEGKLHVAILYATLTVSACLAATYTGLRLVNH